MRKTVFFSALLLIALHVETLHAQTVQKQVQQGDGSLSEELASIIKNRRGLINSELGKLHDHEWAGVYYAEDGPTAGAQLSWAPASGFTVFWSTCSHGWRERANYGRVAFQDGLLKLMPEMTANDRHLYPVATEYVPVLWGERHYLIPSDGLIRFCYAARNAGASPEFNSFLVRTQDSDKLQRGRPQVPSEYRKYLTAKPITASISAIAVGPEPWFRQLTLDVGRTEGVVSGMNFYVAHPRDVYMLLEISRVQEHRAEAYVITSGHKDGRDGEVMPGFGWKLTSRAPKD